MTSKLAFTANINSWGGVFQGGGNICDTLGSVHSVAAAASLQPQHACQQEHVFHVTNRWTVPLHKIPSFVMAELPDG